MHDFRPLWGLISELYHNSGPGRPFYSPESIIKALLLQRFLCIPSERALAEKLAKFRDYRRVCGFRRYTPSRGCFTHFRRRRFKEAFNFMVEQAIAIGAVRGSALAIDSTPFKAYSCREAKKSKSDPDAGVGRAGRTYILGYRLHLACIEGDVPSSFKVQPISRNNKLFYRQLLRLHPKAGVRFRVVAVDRQYDSTMLRQWTWKNFNAETAIPTCHKNKPRKSYKRMLSSGFQGLNGLLRLTIKGYALKAFSRS